MVQVRHSANARQGCAEKPQQKLCDAAGVPEPARERSRRSIRTVSMAAVPTLAHSSLPAADTSCADID